MEKQTDNTGIIAKFAILLSLPVLLTGILLVPVIFEPVLAFGDLLIQDREGLTVAAIIFVVVAVAIFFFRKKMPVWILMTVFTCLFLIWIEFGFRWVVKASAGESFKKELAFKSNVTYPEAQAYQGSPFLHFTGKPEMMLEGSMALKAIHPYNNFGFMGSDFFYYKPYNVIRIACLGESTTADGYPRILQDYLTTHNTQNGMRYEVYNFGHAYWTTAHSLTNFMLNVLDFSPDIVVVHHGWNEAKIRNYDPGDFRGDYSHRFKSFEVPVVPDRFLIRTSGLYRYFKFSYDKSPHWMSLAGTIETEKFPSHTSFANMKELVPFRRNLENLLAICSVKDIPVILATLPFSTDSTIAMREGMPNIIQCNQITRALRHKYPGHAVLCDLDSLITGKKNDIFVDLGHVTDEGRDIKSMYIGNAILGICDTSFIRRHGTADKGYGNENGVDYYLDRMRNDEKWMKNDLVPKAERMGIGIDSIMKLDARFLVEQDKLHGTRSDY